jgi:hypothetical protein
LVFRSAIVTARLGIGAECHGRDLPQNESDYSPPVIVTVP